MEFVYVVYGKPNCHGTDFRNQSHTYKISETMDVDFVASIRRARYASVAKRLDTSKMRLLQIK